MTDDDLRGLISKYMEIRHIKSLEALRVRCVTVSKPTFLKKWHNFKTFTIEELLNIFNYLKIPYEERQDVFKSLKG